MAAQQRKHLERLMGSVEGPSVISFDDPKLCKAYCVDFCVADLFSGTKAHLGRCPYTHIERAQMLYRGLPAKIPAFEREFERSIAKAAASVKRRIAVAEESLAVEVYDSRAQQVQEEIASLGAELSAAGRRGDITPALMENLQTLEAKRLELKKLAGGDTPVMQKLQVCQTCASLLSPAESDKRLADHFTGKIHRACAQVLEALEGRRSVHK